MGKLGEGCIYGFGLAVYMLYVNSEAYILCFVSHQTVSSKLQT